MHPEPVCGHVQHLRVVLGLASALGVHTAKATGAQPRLQFFCRGVGGQLHGESDDPARVAHAQGLQLRKNGLCVVVLHGLGGLLVKQLRRPSEQQLQMVVEFGHGAHGRARTANWVGLVDGNRCGHTIDFVDSGSVHAV